VGHGVTWAERAQPAPLMLSVLEDQAGLDREVCIFARTWWTWLGGAGLLLEWGLPTRWDHDGTDPEPARPRSQRRWPARLARRCRMDWVSLTPGPSSSLATLRGALADGTLIVGTDSIRLLGAEAGPGPSDEDQAQ
jgi:hypothetical protein